MAGWRKLLAQFADPLVYLLVAAVAISLVVWAVEGRTDGVPFEALVITAILFSNAFHLVLATRSDPPVPVGASASSLVIRLVA